SGAPALLLLRRYQVKTPVVVPGKTPGIVPGRTTPRVVVPLPSQSPATGLSPAAPYRNGVKSGAPAPLLFLRYQVIVPRSTTPMVVLPSRSQSPTRGTQPGAP